MKLKSKTHGYLDYLVGVLLIAAPWIFDFYRAGIESWVPIIMGSLAIAYSLFTDYEMGAIRVIPFRGHLTLDIISGIALAASPWLLNFSEYVYAPHLIVGLLEIGVATLTNRHTSIEVKEGHSKPYNANIGNRPNWSH